MTEYPEHDKVQSVRDQSQAIGEFLDQGKYHLCEIVDDRFVPVYKSIEQILAEWFGVDLGVLEQEKRAMLEEARAAA